MIHEIEVIVLQREQQVYILPEQITVLTEDMDSAMARDDSINSTVIFACHGAILSCFFPSSIIRTVKILK